MKSTSQTTEAKREKLLELLSGPDPVWKTEDHPELKDGAAAWISKMRKEDDLHRSQKIAWPD